MRRVMRPPLRLLLHALSVVVSRTTLVVGVVATPPVVVASRGTSRVEQEVVVREHGNLAVVAELPVAVLPVVAAELLASG